MGEKGEEEDEGEDKRRGEEKGREGSIHFIPAFQSSSHGSDPANALNGPVDPQPIPINIPKRAILERRHHHSRRFFRWLRAGLAMAVRLDGFFAWRGEIDEIFFRGDGCEDVEFGGVRESGGLRGSTVFCFGFLGLGFFAFVNRCR